MSSLSDLKKYTEKRTGEDILKTGKQALPFTFLPTGVFLLDFALLGGYPEGRISTIFGQKSSGKTTLCHKAVGNFQRKYDGVNNPKKYAVWIDTEQSYDSLWAHKNGVNIDELQLIQPFDGDSAADIFNSALENDEVGLVILDSIANLVGNAETLKSVEDHVMAPVARIAQRMLRKASTTIAKSISRNELKTALLINQWREKPVMMGDPRSLPGGKYIRYYSTLELEVYNKKQIIEKDEHDIDSISRNEHAFKVVKNRAGNSIQEGEFDMLRRPSLILPEAGIDDFDTVTTYAQKFGFIEGQGAKWSFTDPDTGVKLDFKGKKYIAEMITNEPELYHKLQRKMISMQRTKQGMEAKFW